MRLPTYQDLSKEQDAINNLPLDGSYLVTGPPGTGKTVMALYRTAMITKKDESVMLLAFSRLLSIYLSAAVKELSLDGRVKTFHSWFAGFYKRTYGERAPQLAPYVFDFDEILATVNESPPEQGMLPYLIIDEAQDLSPKFFVIARYIGRRLTVFADENQQLKEEHSTIGEIRMAAQIETPTYELRRNYRNTKEIAAVAACFYTGLVTGKPDPPTRGGEKPALLTFENLTDAIEFIARYERNNSQRSIGVFTVTRNMQKKLVNRLKSRTANPVQFYSYKDQNEVDFGAPGVVVVNYASAKGLEFDTVFLPELQALKGDATSAMTQMQFYVLTSRAREELFFAWSGSDEPTILEPVPAELIERRTPSSDG